MSCWGNSASVFKQRQVTNLRRNEIVLSDETVHDGNLFKEKAGEER